MRSKNPFTPSFGKVPPTMAGRAELFEDMAQACDEGSGNPNLSTVFAGPRGTGKTAAIFALSRQAASQGWLAVNVSAVPGMLDDILQQTLKTAAQFVDEGAGVRLKGVSLGQVLGIEWEPAQPGERNWRSRMEDILDALAEYDIGLLITVDEVKPDLDEMVQLASTYQHFVGEDRKVALFMAGLPSKVSSLVSDESISFLRRSCRRNFGRISNADVAEALRATIEEGGRTIGDDALDAAVEAIDGFPYMMQLVGFRAWAQHPAEKEITLRDVQRGIEGAQRDFRERVLDATYYDLSAGDARMLEAMLADPDESRLSDLAARMGESSSYVSTYKKRLVEQGVIGERGRSVVAFELPGIREYLAERLG